MGEYGAVGEGEGGEEKRRERKFLGSWFSLSLGEKQTRFPADKIRCDAAVLRSHAGGFDALS